jgi:molybdopterin molybdotransferase
MSRKPDDVRMKGFKNRSTVSEAIEWTDKNCVMLQSESEPIQDAFHRILSEDIQSSVNVPSFRRSSMDGYAIQGLETSGASDFNPIEFQITGQSFPGNEFTGTISKNEAVEIMTGSPVPDGADAVIPVEQTQKSENTVSVTSAVSPGKNVAEPGEDIKAGSDILLTGRCLRPQDIGLLASLGISDIPVVRKPRVRLIVTGQELVEPGTPLKPNQIYDSNSSMLQALIHRDGGILEKKESIQDHRDDIRQALTEDGADIILVSGGSSVGKDDHAPSLVSEVGKLEIHGIAMRPSSPTGVGKIGRTLVFLLPGNPVSCLCAYDFFARRAIRIMGYQSLDWPYSTSEMKVNKKIVSDIGRLDYCRVCIGEEGIEPLAISGASILSSTTKADGFVIVPEEYEGYPPGSIVTIYHYDDC